MDNLDISKVEIEPKYEFDYLVDDMEMLAKYYIDLYFDDKQMPDGSIIPKKMLYAKHYINRVLNVDISAGMDLIYQAVGIQYTNEQMRHFERQGQIPDDIKHVIALLRDCSKRGIPKQFAAGIIIMYLELCKGHKLEAA